MSRTVTVKLQLPGDLARLSMPPALNGRLQDLLDRQDHEGKLSIKERREARALIELAEFLSLIKLRARRSTAVR